MHIFPGKKSIIVFLGAVVVLSIIIFQKTGAYNSFLSFNRNTPEKSVDPAVAGPNDDLVDSYTTSNTRTSGDGVAPLNLTDQIASQISENVFNTYINSSSSTTAPVPEKIEVDQASIVLSNKFSAADIITVSESPEALMAYGDGITSALSSYEQSVSSTEGELNIIATAINTQDSTDLVKLDGYVVLYENLISSLRSVVTPITFSDKHIALLNSMQKIKESTSLMRSIVDDPLQGLIAFNTYTDNWEIVGEIAKEMNSYLKERGVEFDSSVNKFIIVKTN